MKIKFAVLNLILAFVLAAGFFAGITQRPFISDHTGITVGIAMIFVAGLVNVWREDWNSVRWCAWMCINVGLIGTVAGIIITVTSLSGTAASVQDLLKTIAVGSGVALYTNITGCFAYVWLSVNAFLLAREDI